MLHTGDVLVDQLLIPFVLWIFIVAVDLDQQLGKGVDTMHLTLDRWVGSFPRAAGWTLALGSAFVLIASMIVWLGRH